MNKLEAVGNIKSLRKLLESGGYNPKKIPVNPLRRRPLPLPATGGWAKNTISQGGPDAKEREGHTSSVLKSLN